MTTDADILTPEQAAEILQCAPDTIRDKASANNFPAFKLGRDWCIPRQTLIEYACARARDNMTTPDKPSQPAATLITTTPPPRGRRRGRGARSGAA